MNKIYGRKGGKSTEIPPNYNQSTLLTLRFDNPEFPQSPDLAHGKYTSAGFKLHKGSLISQDHKNQKNTNIKQILKDLSEDNVLESEYDDGIYYKLKSDITLHSSSTAACLVYGNSRNGNTSWKNGDKTLKQLLDV